MIESIQGALDNLRDIASVRDVRALADSGHGSPARLRTNVHFHLPPNFSAFHTVGQAVQLADEQEVRVLGTSNYYDFSVYGPFAAEARRRGVFPLFGTELIARLADLAAAGVKINDPDNPGKMYLCGKGITRLAPMSPRATDLMNQIRRNDSTRMAEMTARLAAVFAERGLRLGLTAEGIKERVVRRSGCSADVVYLQERHLSQAFQEALFEKVPPAERVDSLSRILKVPYQGAPDDSLKVQGEIRSHLMKTGQLAFVPEKFLDFQACRELILELGGIPCYPTLLTDGVRPVCAWEEPVDALLGRLRGLDIHCAELIPIRNPPGVLRRCVLAMREAGLAVSAGTEHNTLDLIGMEPTCLRRQPVPGEVQEIFWEGACVIAAHQFLTLHGEFGYVDANGRPNPAYRTADERIRAMARLGAAVVHAYRTSAAKQGA
jgi:hypothetical protein